MTYFSTPAERARYIAQQEVGYPHAHPGSTLVVSCGQMWKPGCWQAVTDMVAHTLSQKVHCDLYESPDCLVTLPYMNLGQMKDSGVLRAIDSGFEYVCLVDCDIKPKPDLLLNLLALGLSVVAPIIIDPVENEAIGMPTYKPNMGVQPMRWIPMSLMLMKTTVFNATGISLFSGTFSEGDAFQKLWHYGHRPWLDTDQVLEVMSPPTRMSTMPLDERWKFLEEVDRKRRMPADRTGDTSDHGTMHGDIYSPFSTNGVTNGRE